MYDAMSRRELGCKDANRIGEGLLRCRSSADVVKIIERVGKRRQEAECTAFYDERVYDGGKGLTANGEIR
jgi:hypothetical protein